jgi:hypothetical protein
MDDPVILSSSVSCGKKRKFAYSVERVTTPAKPRTPPHLKQSNAPRTEDQNVCSECAKIDFEAVFNIPPESLESCEGYSLEVAKFGRRLESASQSSCFLCRFFGEVRLPTASLSPEYSLRAFSLFRNYAGLSYSRIPQNLRGNDSIFLAVITAANADDTIKNHCWRQGYILQAPSLSGNYSERFYGRILKMQVDFAVLGSWLAYCRQNHTSCGIHPSSAILPGLKLIDCETLTICSASNDSIYAALSYVWGNTSNSHNSTSISNIPPLKADSTGLSLPRVLPKVVRSAITVTKELGMRYLWVDKFCIDQRNASEKHEQISKMDMIYKGSEVTIIAAAGQDENHCLAGVGKMAYRYQPSVKVGSVVLTTTHGHPVHAVHNSKWSSRGWTYQEAVLARRRLVFTEKQVYFECESMNCCESVISPLPFLHTKNKKRFRNFVRSGIFAGKDDLDPFGSFQRPNQTLGSVLIHIEHYTKRDLSFESDSINALLGVLHLYQNSSPRIFHLYGLPFSIDSVGSSNGSLSAALAWHHTKIGAVRRPRFPAWSWAGWKGEVSFALKWDSLLKTNHRSLIEVFLESEDGIVVDINDFTRNGNLLALSADGYPILRLRAYVLHPRALLDKIEHLGGDNTDNVFSFRLKACTAWAYLSSPSDNQILFREKIETREWECLVLSTSYSQIDLLIIEWDGLLALRVGALSLTSISAWYSDPFSGILPAERRLVRLG